MLYKSHEAENQASRLLQWDDEEVRKREAQASGFFC